VAGATVAVFISTYRARIEIPERPVYDAERVEREIDAWSPGRAWDEWKQMREEGLGYYQPPAHHMARRALERTKAVIVAATIISLCGVVAAVAACLFRGTGRG
jgi:hypothetical protein